MTIRRSILVAGLLLCGVGEQLLAFDPAPYEEPAGPSFAFHLNPDAQIYGIAGGSGTWLTGTPIFGDYFVALFSNELEDAVYSGVGMTFRIMPHWRVAPFVGIGGGYNYSLSHGSETNSVASITIQTGEHTADRGTSYWAGHGEAGVRVWFNNRLRLLELMLRYTATSHDGDRDYWLIGISTGTGI